MYEVSWVVTRDRSTEIMDRTKTRIGTQLELGCNRILDRAQGAVAVRTGYTRDTGKVVRDNIMQYRVVFGGAGIYLEFGTAHMAAQPFILPSAQAEKEQILQDVAKQVGGNIRPDYLAMALGTAGGFA